MSEVSRFVANFNERKNLHSPVYGVKVFVCLSVCYNKFELNGIPSGLLVRRSRIPNLGPSRDANFLLDDCRKLNLIGKHVC